MMRQILFIYLTSVCFLNGQNIDENVLHIQQRMETIQTFTANVTLDVDISFVNIPEKEARIEYIKDQETKVFSEDFILIPKKGLDVSMHQLFKNPFITVDRGEELRNGNTYKMVNIIPTDKKADFSIATALVDTIRHRIVEYEINTKKDGTYIVKMSYDKDTAILPDNLEVEFEIERIRIPLKYMGKDAQVDKSTYKSNAPKTGIIYLNFNYSNITYQ